MARILLADDDPTTLDLVGRTLEADGHEVIRCTDGQEAFQRFSAAPRSFNLLITDLDMPGISGRELLEATDPGCRVIIVTGDPSFALEAFRFNVVITDLDMPGIDGIELASRAAAAAPQLRILVMSGFSGSADSAEDLGIPAAGFISKPLSLDQMREAVNSALA